MCCVYTINLGSDWELQETDLCDFLAGILLELFGHGGRRQRCGVDRFVERTILKTDEWRQLNLRVMGQTPKHVIFPVIPPKLMSQVRDQMIGCCDPRCPHPSCLSKACRIIVLCRRMVYNRQYTLRSLILIALHVVDDSKLRSEYREDSKDN